MTKENGYVNNAFNEHQDEAVPNGSRDQNQSEDSDSKAIEQSNPDRLSWDKPIEFLMSCIAMNVGLGNIWRFPFVAYENGGGAFLIPYILVLMLMGRPMYYLEACLGQFASRGNVKIFENLAPALKDGIGTPDWQLALCLLVAWAITFGVCAKGVQSSGKASYFLALFPYVVLLALLIRAVTLEGSGTGILYFINPKWDKLLDAKVWYNAVTQCFFSLNIGFGSVSMYASYNGFRHNVYKVAMVITTLDTLTSLLAGTIIFGILGNLASKMGVEVSEVVKSGGTGLAFISYPEALAKFEAVPWLFAILFFLMLFVLGVGSLAALQGCAFTVVMDAFPKLKIWHVSLGTAVGGFVIGLVYVTPTNGIENPTFVPEPDDSPNEKQISATNNEKAEETDLDDDAGNRAQWGNSVEFLMSCIAMSVGLGNIWRFPFTAKENGGGAFLIPYIIVLTVIGRPLYYMEMALGQFSSRGNVKMYEKLSPVLKSIGFGQLIGSVCVATYYCCLMAITLFYLAHSFTFSELPWTQCKDSWNEYLTEIAGYCVPSTGDYTIEPNRTSITSSELWFRIEVLRQTDDISNGIGSPDWRLTLCLLASWVVTFLVSVRGVKSSGKASYFLALFPYVIMITLLIRAATLEGAGNGMFYFIDTDFDKLKEASVWYAAVTQCFFSLNVGFGSIIMYSSYNPFKHNINRDALIVTTLDTFTSLLSGTTIFGILGNLAYNLGTDMADVISGGGTGLAFISYPEAIARFNNVPWLFAILFFFMLFVLGVGSLVALQNCLNTVIKDAFPSIPSWVISVATASGMFLIGLMYVTPGGQYMLDLVDHFGGTFIIFVFAILEVLAIVFLYG
ncbi:hypothetical protein HUJ05_009886 [Dendroctonus ponderosae]|nr:hypothetical protein HUJ05_009886 [Dendroctonus ponderosae]